MSGEERPREQGARNPSPATSATAIWGKGGEKAMAALARPRSLSSAARYLPNDPGVFDDHWVTGVKFTKFTMWRSFRELAFRAPEP
jgi:hypothetical protein